MGYDSLPLEIEFKILDELDWTETVACSQVCVRWRNYLSKSKAHSKRYLSSQHLPEPTNLTKYKTRKETRILHNNFSLANSEITVSISTNSEPETDFDDHVRIVQQDVVLNRSPPVLLHNFMYEAEYSFGFFITIDPNSSRCRNLAPEGFFLIGNRRLYSSPNSLGGHKGSLLLPESSIEHDSSSEDSIDSEDEKDEAFFSEKGRYAVQLNSNWHWDEKIFNSPMCDTDIIYGRGFETFKTARRTVPYSPRIRAEKYLRRLSELDFEREKPITVRQLVGAITRSVTTIKRLEPHRLSERGEVFFVKFDGIRIQEYMKYIPHGFFDFQTGGRIELEIYQGVNWVEDINTIHGFGRKR